jgi:hypothetical protein
VRTSVPDHVDDLRVLAVAEDLRGLVTACRVHAPLLALKRLGIVREFLVTDSTLAGVPRDYLFDVLWVQRAPEPRLSRRIAERFDGSYLHDMDDLLLAPPGYIAAREFPEREPLVALIESSAVFTAPSQRLVDLVERQTRGSVAGRAFLCPNALEFPLQPPRVPERPSGLVFTQSHRLALTESREVVLRAVREFAAREKLPLFYFGPPPEILGSGTAALLGPVVGCGYLDFWRYHAALAAWPSMIGVAPLETTGDQVTLDFIAGKSDVKMVEYGGFGHPSVYSRAAPYEDTDLCAGLVVENSAREWSDALAEILDGGWRRLAAEQLAIVEARSLERVALEHWAPALRAARIAGGGVAADLSSRRPRRRPPRAEDRDRDR